MAAELPHFTITYAPILSELEHPQTLSSTQYLSELATHEPAALSEDIVQMLKTIILYYRTYKEPVFRGNTIDAFANAWKQYTPFPHDEVTSSQITGIIANVRDIVTLLKKYRTLDDESKVFISRIMLSLEENSRSLIAPIVIPPQREESRFTQVSGVLARIQPLDLLCFKFACTINKIRKLGLFPILFPTKTASNFFENYEVFFQAAEVFEINLSYLESMRKTAPDTLYFYAAYFYGIENTVPNRSITDRSLLSVTTHIRSVFHFMQLPAYIQQVICNYLARDTCSLCRMATLIAIMQYYNMISLERERPIPMIYSPLLFGEYMYQPGDEHTLFREYHTFSFDKLKIFIPHKKIVQMLNLDIGTPENIISILFKFLQKEIDRLPTPPKTHLIEFDMYPNLGWRRFRNKYDPYTLATEETYVNILSELLSQADFEETQWILYPRQTEMMLNSGQLNIGPSSHITLLALDISTKTIYYFDSLGDLQGDAEKIISGVRSALKNIADKTLSINIKKRIGDPFKDWYAREPINGKYIGIPKQSPRSYFCTQFALMYAWGLITGSFNFTEESLIYLRYRSVKKLLIEANQAV